MKKILAIVATFVVVGIIGAQLAITAPEPSAIPIKWELDFEYQVPQPIEVIIPGESKPKLFWYMLYKVTNRTVDQMTGRGTEQDFIPEFVMYTETGQMLYSGQRISSAVFDAIKQRHNNPLLQNQADITGRILFGEDNAKDGVAIWPDFDPKAGSFEVFVSGLSGETAEVKLPRPITVTETDAFGESRTVTKDKVILSKTLQASFTVQGETQSRMYTKAKARGKKWVLR